MQWPLTWRGSVLSGIVSMTVWAYARNASGEIPPGYPPLDREDAAHRGEAQGIGFGGQHPCVLTLWKPPCASRNGGFSFRA